MPHPADRLSQLSELSDAIAGKADAEAWIRRAALENRLSAGPEPIDVFADAVSRLCDAEVILDEVERLLLAIERVEIIDGRSSVLLHAAYLNQRRAA